MTHNHEITTGQSGQENTPDTTHDSVAFQTDVDQSSSLYSHFAESRDNIKERYDQFADKHPYVVSMGETALVFGLRYALEKAGEKVGVPLGHGRAKAKQKLVEKHPVIAASVISTLGPAAEELVFRELPDRFLQSRGHDKDSVTARRTKLAVSALFAATHAGPDAVPLPQFIGGLNYNRIHEKRGVQAATVAHATNNALAITRHLVGNRRSK